MKHCGCRDAFITANNLHSVTEIYETDRIAEFIADLLSEDLEDTDS